MSMSDIHSGNWVDRSRDTSAAIEDQLVQKVVRAHKEDQFRRSVSVQAPMSDGICKEPSCGRKIPDEYLVQRPYAKLCPKCRAVKDGN